MQNENSIRQENSLIAIYPGTFDPITYGHIDLVKRSIKIVDRLIIAVSESVHKNPLFSLDERIEMVKHEVKELNLSKEINVIGFTGLLVDLAQQHNAKLLIRGIRAVSDFEYEFQMSCMNSRLNSEIETMFLPASEKTHFVASKLIKEIVRLKGDVTNMAPLNVINKIKQKYIIT
ncbi:MAG: pantetheine-phosphate adenylyltransferase, partial [Pseudomonadota bacterium]